MEKIISAAIRYRSLKNKEFSIITGFVHADCIYQFSLMKLKAADRDIENEIQGFMTNTNRFVNRSEALQIAKAAHQVIEPYKGDTLFSEHLDFNRERYKN